MSAGQLLRMWRPEWLGRVPHEAWFVWMMGILTGVTTMLANAAGPIVALYLLAIHGGLLSLVGVITALYPVSTVGLAVTLDKEKLHTSQIIGLILAAISLSMVGYASNS